MSRRCCCDGPPCSTPCIQVFGCYCLPLSGATVDISDLGTYTTDDTGLACFPSITDVPTPTTHTVTITATGYETTVFTITRTCLGISHATGSPWSTCSGSPRAPGVSMNLLGGYVCNCQCPHPMPKTLTITTPKSSGTMLWQIDGSWHATLYWHEDEAGKFAGATSDIGAHCNCLVKAGGPVKAEYSLYCTVIDRPPYGPVRTWSMLAQFPALIMRTVIPNGPFDNDCYKYPDRYYLPGHHDFSQCTLTYGALRWDQARLANTDFGPGTGINGNGWLAYVADDVCAASPVLNFMGSIGPLGAPEIPLSATVTH